MEFCINKNGEAIIPINPDGLPSAECVVPTIAYKSEERLKEIEKQLDVLALQGKWVDGWKWIKNEAFDNKGEKTTAEIKFRICKNAAEARIVANKIRQICTRIESEVDNGK